MTSTNLSRLRLEGQKRVAVYHSSVLSPPDVSVVGRYRSQSPDHVATSGRRYL